MDKLSLRFPHLAEGIFNSLDKQSLSNCRIVNSSWKNYLDRQKFFQIRKIKENITTFHVIGEPWELIFRKAGIDILRKLFYAVRKSFKSCRSNMNTHGFHFGCTIAYDEQSATPLLVAAAYGDFKFFKRMMDLSGVKKPETEELETLLCLAAEKGNFRICRLLLKTLNDMGWKEFLCDEKIIDLLRAAAEEGGFQIFKLLIHTLNGEKNQVITVDDDDWTLLTISAQHGHWKTCELIMKNNNNNNIFHRCLCQARMFPISPSRQGGERYHPTAICTEVLT